MELIAGIKDVRPGLTSYIESARGGTPVIITVNSEPQAVLISYEKFRQLEKAFADSKRLALAFSLEGLRAQAADSGITAVDVEREIADYRSQNENRS